MIILEHARPIARKAHRCQECRRPIWGGERYHRQRIIGEDGPYTWKCCAQCAAFLDDLMAQDFRGWDDYSYPDLSEIEWADVVRLGEVWVRRVALWKRQWRRRVQLVDYPTETAEQVAS